jgi:two-component system, NtrC family, response regulator HydG
MALRILIVDDEPDLVDSCARLLGWKGHECLRANGELEAIAMIDTLAPDVVLTDLYLPDGGGMTVARYARRHSPRLPVIVMTAYDSPDAVAAAAAAGAAAYLRKPFAMADLDYAVSRVARPRRVLAHGPHG